MSGRVMTKHPMPVQDPGERINNFNEVTLGYSEEVAVAEAQRCLECKKSRLCKGLSRRDQYSRIYCRY